MTDNGNMTQGGSSGPPSSPGAQKKRAVGLQVKLPCDSLDAVKSAHPEIRDRRFVLHLQKPPALDAFVRLDARLSHGEACFVALGVVERVVPAGEVSDVTVALLAMDDAGRELVAWMGGKPPRLMAEEAAAAATAKPEAAAPKGEAAPAKPAAQAPKAAKPAAAPSKPEPAKSAPPQPSKPAPSAVAPAGDDPWATTFEWAKHDDDATQAGGDATPSAEPPRPQAPVPKPPPVAAKPAEPVRAPPRAEAPKPVVPAPPPAKAEAPKPPAKAEAPKPVAPPPPPAKAEAPKPVAPPPPVKVEAPKPPAPKVEQPKPAPKVEPPPVEVPPEWETVDPTAAPAWPGEPAAATREPDVVEIEAEIEVPAEAPKLAADHQARKTAPAPEPRAPLARSDYPPPSSRPSPAPMPRPTLAPGAPGGAEPTVVEDVAPELQGTKQGLIIGIDLGTTNSAAAVVKDGKPFIIPSREGYSTIPSVVAVNDKSRVIVGHAAKGQLLINPRNTVYGMKRLVGRQFKSPVVSDLIGRFSYEIVAGTRGEAAVKLGDKIYSLQKISSLVLSELKELAERWLGAEVSRAVITVPAYYNDNQRQAVRAAGALAGLEVERILNEPTAAAISFAHGRKLQERVMVYDLGGGTFDTSVLELHGSVYEVISTGGDTFLGGADFDKALTTELLERFKRKHGVEFSGDRVAYQRITEAAERAKIALSERLTTEVSVPFVQTVGAKAYDIAETVTRADLEKVSAALLDRTLRVCDDVLTNCGLKPADIAEVLLVGGQSRMPMVRAKVREFFGKEPSKAVHPDEAVAIGAALLADSVFSGEIGGIVLVDVLPMSIGIGLPGGRFKKVVERNTPLPHRKTHSMWTAQAGQKMLEIPIFQGENDHAQDNEYLGTLVVADLPPAEKGNAVFDLVFNITGESILTVSAEERGTARTVTATFSTQDTPETVRHQMGEPEPAKADGEAPKRGLAGLMKRVFR